MEKKQRQHEPLRVPIGWAGQDKALVIQLERLFDELYGKFGRIGMDDLGDALKGLLNEITTAISDLYGSVVTEVAYNTQTGKLTVTIDGETTDVVPIVTDAATQSTIGLMSAEDKTKLDGIEAGANNYSLPLADSGTRGGIQTGYTESGKKYAVKLDSEKAYVEVPWNDTKNSAGTTNWINKKLYLVGAETQATNPTTNSNVNVYIGTDNCLYSNGTKVLTAHQDISGKADKSTTVTAVTYDGTNKKITKTINGTTSDVVSVSTIKSDMGAFTWGALAGQ